MYSTVFWKATLERLIRVAATSALGMLGATQFIDDIDPAAVAGAVGMAVLLDLLTSLTAASKMVPGDGPSLTQAEQTSREP